MLNAIVVTLMVLGLFVFFSGSLGILRFPDFYSRMHPAGKMDTLASLLMLSALALYELHTFSLATVLTAVKIILILLFVFLASPTATHAIVDAGFRAGMEPWVKGSPRR